MKTRRLSQSGSDLFLRSELERWLGPKAGSDDDVLDALLAEVTSEVEGYLNISIVRATHKTILDLAEYSGLTQVYLPRPPLVSVSAVTSPDIDGVVSTMPATDYQVCDGTPGRLALASSCYWPTDGRERDALAVTHLSGYLTSTGRQSQASTDSEVVVSGSTLAVGEEAEAEYHVDAVTKGVTVYVYGSATAAFTVEVLVATLTVAVDTSSRWSTQAAGYAYYRAKIKSTATGQVGTIRLLGLSGSIDRRIFQAIKQLCAFRYRLRGEGYIVNSMSGGNVLLTNDYERRILASIADLKTEWM